MANRGHWALHCGWTAWELGKSVRYTNIKRPTEFILLFDSSDPARILGDKGNSTSDAGLQLSPHATKTDKMGSNILFADGHAAYQHGGELMDNLGMWSRSGVWEDLSSRW